MVAYALEQVEFLSTPSARRATITSTNPPGLSKFLSTPSARRATQRGGVCAGTGGISIHALCEEGDNNINKSTRPLEISIHALCEEGDNARIRAAKRRRMISIHALCEEGDLPCRCSSRSAAANFYPRPPRGGRLPALVTRLPRPEFLSTPSARRATRCA